MSMFTSVGFRATNLAAVALMPLTLAACAPDAWRPSPTLEAFVDQVQRNCGTHRIGEMSVRDLLDGPQQNAAFIDAVTSYGSGRMSKQDFALNAFAAVRVNPDDPALRCIEALKKP